jgi:hypothetical protein
MPGVGARIKERLIDRFGSEDAAIEVILRGDIGSLLEVVSERHALSLGQWAMGRKYRTRELLGHRGIQQDLSKSDIKDSCIFSHRVCPVEDRDTLSIILNGTDNGE